MALAEEERRAAAATWPAEVALLPAAQGVLCRAACRWAGLPLGPEDARERRASSQPR